VEWCYNASDKAVDMLRVAGGNSDGGLVLTPWTRSLIYAQNRSPANSSCAGLGNLGFCRQLNVAHVTENKNI